MANRGSLIGVLNNETPGSDRKRAVKPKTKAKGGHRVTRGEKSVTNPGQQHGELESFKAPTHRQMEKAGALGAMRRATNDWIDGRISSKEHAAIHGRAKHVIAGKHRS